MAKSSGDQTGDNFASLTKASNTFGSSVTNAFASGIAKGKDFDQILQGVTQKFLDLSLKAGLKPLDNLFSSGLVLADRKRQQQSFIAVRLGRFGAFIPVQIRRWGTAQYHAVCGGWSGFRPKLLPAWRLARRGGRTR